MTIVSENDPLARLLDEGYHVSVVDDHLVVASVPYVDQLGVVRYGTLISTLKFAGDLISPPDDHRAYWIGDYPCDNHGVAIRSIRNVDSPTPLSARWTADFTFSSKPSQTGGYSDYHHKMSSYANLISQYATVLAPDVTARSGPRVPAADESSVFRYLDTASTRAGIAAANSRFEGHRVAIVGLGGTGSYVLDLVAKTGVAEIHLYDHDWLESHNAYRAPGAATLEQLRRRRAKVEHWCDVYSGFRAGLIPHPHRIDSDTVGELGTFNFVFVCIDDADAKEEIVAELERADVAFVDTGMDLTFTGDGIGGIARVTSSEPGRRETFRSSVSMSSGGDREYRRNIQVAELNSLSAALAVIRWKKYIGYYRDYRNELHTTYTLDTAMLTNDPGSNG